jgi:AbrB family looped-hinge helix DNA binding protein
MSRLVVPKPLRDRFALKPGDELEVTLEPDGIRLRPVRLDSAISEKKGIFICSSELPVQAWDLGAFIETQREQRSREIASL